MYRSLALLALPLLLAGCGSSGSSSAPPTTIDSFRSSFLGGRPSASSQLAEMPQPAAGQAKGSAKPGSGDRSAKAPAAFQSDSARLQQADNAPYKASVGAYIKRYAADSNSLKLAKIGAPFQGTVNGQKGSVVCVELGGMSSNRTAYLLKNDSVIDSEFGSPACRDKHLEPWSNIGT